MGNIVVSPGGQPYIKDGNPFVDTNGTDCCCGRNPCNDCVPPLFSFYHFLESLAGGGTKEYVFTWYGAYCTWEFRDPDTGLTTGELAWNAGIGKWTIYTPESGGFVSFGDNPCDPTGNYDDGLGNTGVVS